MPKMKTHRGAAKRFKVTKNDKVKYRRGFRNHILTKKSSKRKRHLRANGVLNATDSANVIRMLRGE